MNEDLTIAEFCTKYGACRPGMEWATANCSSMVEAWFNAPEPDWILWIALRPGVLTLEQIVAMAHGLLDLARENGIAYGHLYSAPSTYCFDGRARFLSRILVRSLANDYARSEDLATPAFLERQAYYMKLQTQWMQTHIKPNFGRNEWATKFYCGQP